MTKSTIMPDRAKFTKKLLFALPAGKYVSSNSIFLQTKLTHEKKGKLTQYRLSGAYEPIFDATIEEDSDRELLWTLAKEARVNGSLVNIFDSREEWEEWRSRASIDPNQEDEVDDSDQEDEVDDSDEEEETFEEWGANNPEELEKIYARLAKTPKIEEGGFLTEEEGILIVGGNRSGKTSFIGKRIVQALAHLPQNWDRNDNGK